MRRNAMCRYLFSLLVLLCVFNGTVMAQLLKPLSIDYSRYKVQQRAFTEPVITEKSPLFLSPDSYSNLSIAPACSFKYMLPKGAVFCRLEDAIYNHLNFWVKFRMGTDDRYSN